ncbi:tetratricopeptide repeat protein [Luteimonas salinilitoris]|uniref:Tetratricopeptide repeat protein n=1 Tax=Luteimonas salinilitoris TaxID=3237697 RepID=A0ABV4HU19_9GAMM
MAAPRTVVQALDAGQARQLETALRLLKAGNTSDALAIGRRVAAEATLAPDAQQLLGMCHAEAGDVAAAEQAFRRALELAPEHPLILVNYATLLRKAGRTEEALSTFRRAVDAAPDFAKAWTELGMTALGAGQRRQALKALERAVQLQPGSALAWHALGNARRADGEFEAAEEAFRKALALVPGYGSAWVNLGAVLRLLGRSGEAIACFDRAAESGQAGAELSDARAGVLLDDGRPGEALEQARRVVREHPGFVPGHTTLAHLLWEYGPALASDEDPVAGFRAAVRSQPRNGPLRSAFARFLLSARRADEALDEIRMLRAQDDRPLFAWLEAEALEALDRAEQAGALYAGVHRALGGRDADFLNAYTRHLLRRGKWDAAAGRAAEATRIDPANQQAWAHLATAWRLLDDPREFWLCDYERLVALVEVEPPAGFVGQPDFLDALTATLAPMHQAGREPVQQSLRGGSQTPGRLFGRRDPLLEAARSSLLRAVERWVATLPSDPRHPFLMRKADGVRIVGSWSVRLWSSGNHVNHIHSEGWMSSAYYVSLPPSVRAPAVDDGDAGCIQFGQPPLELGLELAPRRLIRPEPGKLALFPSYLWHGTVPFQDEQPRITIAFDMIPHDGKR